MAKHNELGAQGEQMAVELLVKKGYDILERNWRFHRHEVDVIARIADTIVFVEVKTRSERFLEEPEMAVTKTKQKSIITAANEFLISRDLDFEARFDIVSIVIYPGGTAIDHIEDAFYPLA
jgi:putative endonuclease